MRWKVGDGDFQTLSLAKMEANVNFKHPRLIKVDKDGDLNNLEFIQYPICTPIGNLFYEKEWIDELDDEKKGKV